MAQLTVRIDGDLKEHLDTLARQEGKSTSDIVRMLLRQYVHERDRSTFLEHLWDRMQQRAEGAGMRREDVARAISKVRRETRNSGDR